MSLRSEIIRVLNEIRSNSKKISDLPIATTPSGTELVEIVQGGENKQTTVSDLGGGGGGGNDKLDALLTFSTKTTDYTLQASDKTIIEAGGNMMFVIDSASDVDFNIPLDATVDFPGGTQILVKTIDVGIVTFVPDGIVSIIGSSGSLTSPPISAGETTLMALIKTGTANTWYLENGSAASGGGTVESVTGDGVDNTDPDNPVLTFPIASEVTNTPAGNIAATNVQAAINELDTEKQAALGYTAENVANKATDFSTINNTKYPTTQAVNDLVNSAVEGLQNKADVRIATTANITLSGLQTIDGILTVALDRVLVKDQTDLKENGIYVSAVGAWSRAGDTNTGTELRGAVTSVDEGSTN
ncbi:MAG: hypothetical protein QOA70_08150, partial [Nitrososphaeraceae archaeon]|nr:hypothetical protein [Nitrososphaeraceae archaeon]